MNILIPFVIIVLSLVVQDASATSITVKSIPGSNAPGCENTSQGCFTPKEASIDVGDKVIFSNTDTAAHTFTAGTRTDGPSGVFDSGLIIEGASFEYTFVDAGTYDYYCMVHPWMVGKLVVNYQDDVGNNSPNSPPVAQISPVSSVNEGNQITLSSTSYDPDNSPQPLTYRWMQISGSVVKLDGSYSPALSFIAPNVDKTSNMIFRLEISDGKDSANADISIIINDVLPPKNEKPVATILPVSPVNEGTKVKLDGSQSKDPDESPQKSLTYQWYQISGTSVTISNAKSKVATFIAPDVKNNAQIGFRLDVSDGQDTSSSKVNVQVYDVSIQPPVNSPPVAEISSKNSGEVNSPIEFSGENSRDSDGKIVRYVWNFGDGSESKEGTKIKYVYKSEGTYQVTLTVYDDKSEHSRETTRVEIKPNFPDWIIPVCIVVLIIGGTAYYIHSRGGKPNGQHPASVSYEIKTGFD